MKAVIFDLDGVLVDSEPLHYETDISILKSFGITVEPSYMDKFVGMTNPEMWKIICTEYDLKMEINEILNKQLSLKLKLLKSTNFEAISGVKELMKSLYINGLVIAVASSSSSIFIKEVLNKINLKNYITLYVSAENVKKGKPSPEVYIKVSELIKIEPKNCVAIEDSKNGVLAARNAGMKVIGYKNPNSGVQDLSSANLIVDSFKKLTFEIVSKM